MQKQRQSAVTLGSRLNFRTDHAGFPSLVPSRSNPGSTAKNANLRNISIGYGGESVSQSPLKDQAFSTFLDQNPPFELPAENGDFACDTPVQWTVIDNSATPAPSWTALPWPPSANPPVVGLPFGTIGPTIPDSPSFASCPTFPSTMNFCGVLVTAQPISSATAPTLQNWRQEAGCGDRTDRAILCG